METAMIRFWERVNVCARRVGMVRCAPNAMLVSGALRARLASARTEECVMTPCQALAFALAWATSLARCVAIVLKGFSVLCVWEFVALVIQFTDPATTESLVLGAVFARAILMR